MRLLIAEDDADIARALTALFEHNNYTADAVANGNDAYDYCMSGNYDGVILDIMMPGMDGLEVLKALRANGISIPVLLLTAKSDIEDRVNGLDAGADDYLPKPFAASELLARVRAMLRRKDSWQSEVLEFEGLRLDLSTFELAFGQTGLRLVSREFQMLQLLMQSPGAVISTDQFMEKIWGWDSEVEVSIVWVYISNLRKKFEKLNAPVNIRAVRGVGYCLEKRGSL
ncbi:MAG: response regulator transcription factor [Eubacterium sp.]|nr:response regulator transcription factor [Eubacterium sp.]MCM1216283.1 response regulator transcription factor [Lachnospiraceae bacterium]MCM1303794.1 response regulator transcription factor [Butyrivibrio sp.]MCM1342836.1 response regulator transcription factor [Muribaculaceae bacterium]MCM1240050.1 response regulator transcription factor [Lachnospiraceae bacterium]